MSDSLLNRYALALALVPDQDVAGDLFMDAKSDADLLRRVNSWRHRAGLDPVTELPQFLPPLDPAQEEQGVHLARRARTRRRVRYIGLAAAAAATIFGLGLTLRSVGAMAGKQNPQALGTSQALASDAAFLAQPVAQSDETKDGLTFSIYKTVTTPGEVTLWWELRGTHRLNSSAPLVPKVSLNYPGTSVEHVKTDRTMTRSNVLVGKSTYRAVITQPVDLQVAVAEYGGSKVDWKLKVPVGGDGPSQAPVVLDLNQTFDMGGFQVTVESISITPMWTRVRYRRTLPAGVEGLYLSAYRTPGGPRGVHSPLFMAQTLDSGSELTAQMPPLTSGVGEVDLYFSQAYQNLGAHTYTLPDAKVLTDWSRVEGGASATLHFDEDVFPAGPGLPYVTGSDGRGYTILLRPRPRGGAQDALPILVPKFPEGVTPVKLTIPTLVRTFPVPPVITIDLLHPQP